MPYRIISLALLLALAGCAATPEQETASPEPTQSDSEAVASAAPEKKVEPPQRPFPDDSLYTLLVAEFALRRREYDLALDNYMQESAKLRDAGVSAHTTRLAQFMQRPEQATEASRLWVELDPDNLEARLTLGNLLARQGQPALALEQLEAIVAAGGSANFTVLANGFENMPAEQQQAMLEKLQQMRETYPQDTQLMITSALLLEDMSRYNEALEEVKQVFPVTPNQLQAIVLEVKLRQDLGQTTGLFNRIETVLEQEPENARLRMQYARLLTRTDLAEAQRQFELLLGDAPNNPDLLFSLALIHRENQEYDRARQMLQNLLATGQRTDEAYFYLGKTAEQQQQYEQALQFYMQVNPGRDFMNAINRIADLLLTADQEEELDAYFEQLRQRYPEHAEQFYALQSDSLSSHDRHQASLEVLNRGLQQYPDSTSLQYSRSMVYEELDELEMFERDLRAILQRDPDNATALNALGYTLANRTDRFDEAEQLISRALELDPAEPAILDSMGWIKYRLGHYEEALIYLQQAYASFPDPEVAAHLGEVLWVLGDKEAAQQVWSTALATSPDHAVLLETLQRLGVQATNP